MSYCNTILLQLVIVISGIYQCYSQTGRTPRVTVARMDPDYTYPISYKDHIYTSLSDNARELFFAINIHPSCLQKKGECIPRGKCIEKKMLYISRVCYVRDLVCCYMDIIKHPLVERFTKYPPPTKKPQDK